MTKTLFIPARSKSSVNTKKIKSLSKKLPKELLIAYSIQFEQQAEQIKEVLSKSHNITSFKQVLGCSNLKFSDSTDAILLIGSGRFHAINLAINIGLPIYILDNNSLQRISQQDIDNYKKKKKVAMLKYLHADKIGILVSTKPGQNKLKQALKLKKELQSKGKKVYLFTCDNINSSEMENVPDIQAWVNTACPRLDLDLNAINIGDLEF